jgi:hypothetical protein
MGQRNGTNAIPAGFKLYDMTLTNTAAALLNGDVPSFGPNQDYLENRLHCVSSVMRQKRRMQNAL